MLFSPYGTGFVERIGSGRAVLTDGRLTARRPFGLLRILDGAGPPCQRRPSLAGAAPADQRDVPIHLLALIRAIGLTEHQLLLRLVA